MSFCSKSWAVALLLIVTAVVLFPPMSHATQAASSCHGHDVPAPQPDTHQCCQAGHNPAIVAASAYSITLAAVPRQAAAEPLLSARWSAHPVRLQIAPGSPPSSPLLRI